MLINSFTPRPRQTPQRPPQRRILHMLHRQHRRRPALAAHHDDGGKVLPAVGEVMIVGRQGWYGFALRIEFRLLDGEKAVEGFAIERRHSVLGLLFGQHHETPGLAADAARRLHGETDASPHRTGGRQHFVKK